MPMHAGKASVESLLVRLDSAIANEDSYVEAKLRRIADVRSSRKKARTPEEVYWNNRQLYDEYYVFDADSAMHYANENLQLAKLMENKQGEYEWRINKSFTLSVMGLLVEAKTELDSIIFDELEDANKIKYYGQMAYLYSHIGQLADHRIIGNDDYDRISHSYEDSITAIITPDNPEYLWYAASARIDKPEFPEELFEQLKEAVDTCNLTSRIDAMNCYILSRIYDRKGDQENRMRYLILSGLTDVQIANRDIASINELSSILQEEGDIERAYNYVNFSLKQALLLPNRVRAASLAKTVSEVHQLHEAELKSTQRNLTIALVILFVIMLALVLMIVMYSRRSRQLRKSQRKLEDANKELTVRMDEITRNKSERDKLISNLMEANTRNQEISEALREANYVKEECIGATFALCSSYIDRFEKYRNDVMKLIRAQKWKELQEETLAATYSHREMKDFYANFDTLFLNIYPDFVSDFNKLLRPEEQISVPSGTLNTELRIYALVRLGVTDSVKIAAMLHCSTQTVYNYRLRMRNRAIIEKERFAEAVMSLGKFNH